MSAEEETKPLKPDEPNLTPSVVQAEKPPAPSSKSEKPPAPSSEAEKPLAPKLAIFLKSPTAHGLHSLVKLSDVRTLDGYVRSLGAVPSRPKSKLKKQLEDILRERVTAAGLPFPSLTPVTPAPQTQSNTTPAQLRQPAAVPMPVPVQQQQMMSVQQQQMMVAMMGQMRMQQMMGRGQMGGMGMGRGQMGGMGRAQMPMQQMGMFGMQQRHRGQGYQYMTGDWKCPGCGYDNWARNLACKQCSTANPNPSPFQHSGAGYNWKPGDWRCRKCNYDNWAKNPSCKQCSSLNPDVAGSMAAFQTGAASNSGTGYSFKPGDWKCTCGYDNWASRNACKSCGSARGGAGLPGFGAGRGGSAPTVTGKMW